MPKSKITRDIFAEINSRILYKIVVKDIFTRGLNKDITDTTLCIISNNEEIIYQFDVNCDSCYFSRFYCTWYSINFPIGLLSNKPRNLLEREKLRRSCLWGHQEDQGECFSIKPSLIEDPKSPLEFPVENEIIHYKINGCESEESDFYVI
jgi:hypothetical protein